MTEVEVKKLQSDFTFWLKVWRTRRKACIEVCDCVCEGADLKRGDLFEKVGIESDVFDLTSY